MSSISATNTSFADHFMYYTALTIGGLAVATVVYRIWGTVGVGLFFASVYGAYYFREEICWFIYADSWWPAVRNSILYPVMAHAGGLFGLIGAIFFSTVGTVRDQWYLSAANESIHIVTDSLQGISHHVEQSVQTLSENNQQIAGLLDQLSVHLDGTGAGLNALTQLVQQAQNAEDREARLIQLVQTLQSILQQVLPLLQQAENQYQQAIEATQKALHHERGASTHLASLQEGGGDNDNRS